MLQRLPGLIAAAFLAAWLNHLAPIFGSPIPAAMVGPMASVTPSATPTPSVTPSPSVTPAPSITPGPSVTPSPSATPTPSITPTPGPSASPTPSGESLLNISTRARVRTDDNVLIGGFILGGGGTNKSIVVRAIGPSLSSLIPDALLDPSLQLFNSSGQVIASNDDWMSDPNSAALIASGLAPSDSREAAVLIGLVPGAYTVVLPGNETAQNIALVEAYDLDSFNPPLLQNISTRGSVETADGVMIAGVIVGGVNTKAFVIRGIGPSLGGVVANPLPNPVLTLFNSFGQALASNDDWMTNSNANDLIATGLAPDNTLESALLVTLPPGNYTAILSDLNGIPGVGLVEVYNVTATP